MSQPSIIRCASAAANAISLGHPPAEAVKLARRWAERQKALSGSAIRRTIDATPVETRYLSSSASGRLYVSFHYSLYACIYRALAEVAPSRAVSAIIGEQSDDQRALLTDLAARYGFDLDFIESGSSMIRRVRAALKDGRHAVILLDVPWSRDSKRPDVDYPVAAGRFLGHSTVARLVELLDPDHRFLLARSSSGLLIEELDAKSVSEAFHAFGKALEEDPSEYERLDSIHRHFEFKSERSIVATFSVGGERYAYHPLSGNSWRIEGGAILDATRDRGVCEDVRLRVAFQDLIRADVDFVISL